MRVGLGSGMGLRLGLGLRWELECSVRFSKLLCRVGGWIGWGLGLVNGGVGGVEDWADRTANPFPSRILFQHVVLTCEYEVYPSPPSTTPARACYCMC